MEANMARRKRKRWEVYRTRIGNRVLDVVTEEDAREWAIHCLLLGVTIGGAAWITIPMLSLLFV
jgi:hypothetical protein